MRLPLHLPLLSLIAAPPVPPPSTELTFSARHAHSSSLERGAPLFMVDAAPGEVNAFRTPVSQLDPEDRHLSTLADEPLTVRTRKITMRRPRVRPPHLLSWAHAAAAARETGVANATGWIAPSLDGESRLSPYGDGLDAGWEDVEVDAPDVTDRQTLLTLAKMASNAYTTVDQDGWFPMPGFNNSIPIGWEPDADGLRGHVFADDKNSTVIIAIKGTSAGVLGSGGPTAKNDKFNDNLLFSCCCARVDFSWSTVCDCFAGGYKCEQTCLEKALVEESVYATVGTNLYNNVTYLYPNANIWLTGHSLGGSLSALIALGFGTPAVGFEAPGDRLPARRLHLPQPPALPVEMSGITHVYHTADPIPMGACTGTYSGCYAAGFALESKCHTGQTILYDTVTVKGWSVDVRTHRISEVISKVLSEPWPVDDQPKDPKNPKDPKDPKKPSDPKDPNEPDDDPWGDDTPWDWTAALSSSPIDWATAFLNLNLNRWWEWPLPRMPGKGGGDKDGGGDGSGGDDGGDESGGKKPGDPDWDKHGGVPRAKPDIDCVDCYKWEFGDGWKKD